MHLLFHLLEIQHVATVPHMLVRDNDLHPASLSSDRRHDPKGQGCRENESLYLGLHLAGYQRKVLPLPYFAVHGVR